MSPLAVFRARRARRVAREAAARPCCFGRCTTAEQRARAARRPAEPAPPIHLPRQRTEES